MSMSEQIKEKLKPRLFRSGKPENEEYDELMDFFDRLMREKLDAANKRKLTTFIEEGIRTIYDQFEEKNAIHPETLYILIRAILVYKYNNDNKPYPFLIYENEDPKVDDPTVSFMNNIVRRAAHREKLFDRTRDAYTRSQLEAQRESAQRKAAQQETKMEEVDGGAKRKRTTRTKKMKRRHKRKPQRKSKRVTK